MSRLLATIRTDFFIQYRNGFYYVVALLLVLLVILVSQIPKFDWSPVLAPLILGNMMMVTFYFVGGLVLLEKREGTLEAQVVTPLRMREYLGSKLITLTTIALLENLVFVMIVSGLQFKLAPLLIGVISASVIYVLLGFVAVARFDSISEYLMPSMLYVIVFSIPFLDYFELWTPRLMILNPVQGPLLIMKAAFEPVTTGEFTSALISTVGWIAIAYALARQSFRRFLIRKEGVR